MKNEDSGSRAQFSSSIAIFFATLSSAVGLGNIWRFPYMLGGNGGGSFLFLYLICILLVGMPLLIFEFYMGRRSRKNVVGAFGKLSKSKKWEKVGILSCVGSFCQLFFYTTVSGWIFSYVFKAFRGDFSVGVTETLTKGEFESVASSPLWSVGWQIVVVAVATCVLLLGVKDGIEKITKTLMPVLFGLIVFCAIKSLMLPNAWGGVKMLFSVDWTKITVAAVLAAMSLAFFKLALGSGAMVTYGSYFTKDTNIVSTSIKLVLADTLVCILVALIIFPAVHSFGMPMAGGAGLLFSVMPIVFFKMGGLGKILLIAFFVLTAVAAICSMLAIFEVPVAYFSEERNMSRKKAVLLTGAIVITFGVLASLSGHPKGILTGFFNFFDFFDNASCKILFPLAGLCTAIFVGHFTKKEHIYEELSNNGQLKNRKFIDVFYFLIKYITPVLLFIVFIGLIFF